MRSQVSVLFVPVGSKCPDQELTLGPFIHANGVHSAAQPAVFHALGCMRTLFQTEEPHTEQFTMDKDKFEIQIFPIFNDCKRIFLAWGLG